VPFTLIFAIILFITHPKYKNNYLLALRDAGIAIVMIELIFLLFNRVIFREGFEEKSTTDSDKNKDNTDADTDNAKDDDEKKETESFISDYERENMKFSENKKTDVDNLIDDLLPNISSTSEEESALINDNDADKSILSKTIKQYKPHEAQLATYKLIDSVKALESTMNSLAPTLKMGHSIMKNFQSFNFK